MKTAIKAIILISCLLAVTLATYRLHGSPQRGVDDANIFFTYSENVASGNGITYGHNADRVEGVTSMLWMLICATIFSFGLHESAVLVVSVLIVLLTQCSILNAIHRCTADRQKAWPYQCIYGVLVLSSPAYISWMTITLMDTCLWGLIVASMTYVVLFPPVSSRAQIVAAIPFVLAPIARPEGMLVAPVLTGLLWLRSQGSGLRSQTRFCLVTGGVVGLSLAALTAFRLMYFGYPFPNTYYAKVSPSLAYDLHEGKEYFYKFILSSTIIGGLVVAAFVACASWIGRAVDSARFLRSVSALWLSNMRASGATALSAALLLVVPILTGGDHFSMFRFYQPVYPILCLAFVLLISECCVFDPGGFREAVSAGRGNAARLAAVGIVLAYWLSSYAFEDSWSSMRWRSPIAHEFRIAEEGIARGKSLKLLFSERGQYPAIGVITAGGIARTYPGRIIDLMGLNNSYIAHFKGDRKGMKNHAAFEKEAFFHVAPDVLLASPPVPPQTNNLYSVWLKGLLDDSRFAAEWRYGKLSSKQDSGRSEVAFFKKSFLDSVSAGSGLEFRDTMIWSNRWVEVGKTTDGEDHRPEKHTVMPSHVGPALAPRQEKMEWP